MTPDEGMPADQPPPLTEALAEALARVRADREHGASWLAREVARALADASTPQDAPNATTTDAQLAQILRAASAFAAARPSMAAVTNSAARIWWAASAVDGQSPAERLRALHDEAIRITATWAEAAASLARHARPFLHGTIYTHSRSATVEGVLIALAQQPGGVERIIVGEGRPGGEGVATARTLAAASIPVTLVPDMALGVFIGEAQALVLGADSVRADGSVINKVGSYPLALAARQAGVPVYVCCESLKIAAPDAPLHLEEMDPHELLPAPVPGVTARTLYFDLTPADFVTAVISEVGLLSRDDIRHQATEAGQALAALRSGDQRG